MGKALELSQSRAALGSQGFGLVKDGGDAALFGKGRHRYFKLRKKVCRYAPLTSTAGHAAFALATNSIQPQIVQQVASIRPAFVWTDNMEFGRTNAMSERRALRAQCKTSAGQYNINTRGLGSIPVPDFSLPLQRVFATRVQAIESLKATHCAALAELDALFASLQQRAFSGHL